MTFNQIKYFVTVAGVSEFYRSSEVLVYYAAGAEPSNQCYGGRTGNKAFYPGEKTAEADTGRQCAVQPAAEGAVRLCRGCRRCKACKFRL